MDYQAEFLQAVKSGDLDTVRRLVETYRFDPGSDNCYAFRLAADKAHLAIVKFLLPYSDPKAYNSEAFRWAADKGHLEIVKFLLPYSDPKAYGSDAFRLAALNGHLEVVKFLLPHTDPKVVRQFI